jgi:hypothetical protein
LTAEEPSSFTWTRTCLGVDLSPRSICFFRGVFSPQATGAHEEVVIVTSDSGSFSLHVRGTGVEKP